VLLTENDIKYCEPADEFENENTTTAEWDNFMDKLDNLTFRNYITTCENSEAEVIIDETSDFLWDLRFKLYNQRLDKKENKTLEICYSENLKQNTCDLEGFRECMKSVRILMLKELDDLWEDEVNKKLKELASDC
ncbi:uncharacterized protein BDFB_012178, partial [Asbolus verrucosus]